MRRAPIHLFRHRRHLQRSAYRLLVVWLFGIAAAVANACLAAQARGPRKERQAAAIRDTCRRRHDGRRNDSARGHVSLRLTTGAVRERRGARVSLGTVNCPDCCDKSSTSIPVVKTVVDGAGGHGLSPAALPVAVPIPNLPPVQHSTNGLDGGHAPPIAIALLRLAHQHARASATRRWRVPFPTTRLRLAPHCPSGFALRMPSHDPVRRCQCSPQDPSTANRMSPGAAS